MIYWTIWFLLIFFSFFDRVAIKSASSLSKSIKILFVFFAIYLTVFAGTRVSIGYDYDQYFELFSDGDFLSRSIYGLEPGFNFFVTVLEEMGPNTIFLVVAVVAIGLKTSLIAKYASFPFLALALYFNQEFLARDMGNIRQGIAIALGLYLFMNGGRWSHLKIIIFIILSMSIHFSSVVLFSFLMLRNRAISKRFLVTSVILSLCVGQLVDTTLLVRILEYINIDYVQKKTADYYSQDDYSSELGLTLGLFLRIIIFMAFVQWGRNVSNRFEYVTIRNLIWFGLIIFLIFNSFEIIAVRMALFFRILDIFAITAIMSNFKVGITRTIIFFIVAAYSFQGLAKELLRHGVYFEYSSWML